ncbi:MAG: septum formation initiator family protein [Bacteroidales bacterium]|nr:septum formation initiator family protein [Bacteroidales bacterium]
MSRFLSLLAHLWQFRSLIAFLFFVVTVGFLDENSFYNYYRLWSKNKELTAEIKQYEKQYEADTRALHQMATSPEAVEKVARVNLLMKTSNEDIYVVVEE